MEQADGDETHVGDETTNFNSPKHAYEQASPLHKFWWGYYTESDSYDYSTDRFGDRKSPMSLGTAATWMFAVIMFSLSYFFANQHEKRPVQSWLLIPWVIFLLLPIALNVMKFEFLFWISH